MGFKIWELVPDYCVKGGLLGYARQISHDITIEGDESLVRDIISEACGKDIEEARAIVERYLANCWFRETGGPLAKTITVVADLSDGRRRARVTITASLGLVASVLSTLLPGWRNQLEQRCSRM